jgi:hypothetical protein
MSASMSAAAIDLRLREASRLAGSLRPEARFSTKVDLSGAGVAARLKEAFDLLDLCRALARAGDRALPQSIDPAPARKT